MTTAFLRAANNWQTTLDGAIADDDLEMTVNPAAVDEPDFPFEVMIRVANNPLIFEIVRVTAMVGQTMTIVRAQGGTDPLSFANASLVKGVISAEYNNQYARMLTDGTADLAIAALNVAGNIVITGTVDGYDVSTMGAKVAGIEAGADVTDETNVLAALLASNAAKDMGGGAITNVGLVDGYDVSTMGVKLATIETGADVTDADNVAAAGALMDAANSVDQTNMATGSVGTDELIDLNVTTGKLAAGAVTAAKLDQTVTTLNSSGGAIAWDWSTSGLYATHTMTEDTTLGAPSNPTVGKRTLMIIQHASSAKTMAFNSAYLFLGGVDFVLLTAVNAVHKVEVTYDGTRFTAEYAPGYA